MMLFKPCQVAALPANLSYFWAVYEGLFRKDVWVCKLSGKHPPLLWVSVGWERRGRRETLSGTHSLIGQLQFLLLWPMSIRSFSLWTPVCTGGSAGGSQLGLGASCTSLGFWGFQLPGPNNWSKMQLETIQPLILEANLINLLVSRWR